MLFRKSQYGYDNWSLNMVKAIRFAIKYSHLIPHFIDFIEVCIDAAGDKKLSKKERGLMLKKYYALVKVIQTS